MKIQFFRGSLSAVGATLILGVLGCAPGAPVEEATNQLGGETLNTFGPDFIQIDQLNGGPPDANLFVGPDPADGSPSVNFPAGEGLFIDWEDVALAEGDNFLYDLDAPLLGRDPSSFPRSNECVGPSSVLSKMDLTYVGAYNNMDHAYFVVQRSANNGDAAYYWLFTKLAPTAARGEAPCRATEDRLLYSISEGDVLFSGHFKPSASIPLLRVFQANQTVSDLLTAVEAINFNSGIWTENSSAIEAAAVNTTITQPGTLGRAGVKSLANGDDGIALDTELIAEVAVETVLFTGGYACGATFFGSVISRSSGSGGTSPDLKDLAGPAVFNFGETTAIAVLGPTCDASVTFEGSGLGMDNTPIENPQCSWVFDTGETSDQCSGTIALPLGARSAVLTVTDPDNGCAADDDAGPVNVYPLLTAEASADPTCEMSFSYEGTPSGGSGEYEFSWAFSGAGSVNPTTSSTASGAVLVGAGNTPYTADLTVTDLRDDGPLCEAFASDVATPYAPIAVYLTPEAVAPICASNDDAVTYVAHPSGGDENYTFAWTGIAGCGGASSCTLNPSDSDFCGETSLFVTVDDGSLLCDAEDSELETYSKVTIVNISDNPAP